MPSILFVCTANRFRSPLAAAILNKYLLESGEKGEWQVASAGTWTVPGQPVISRLEPVSRSLGLELGMHRSAQVDGQLLAAYDLILVMEPGHKEALQVEFPSLREQIYLLSDVVERKKYAVPDTFRSEQQVTEVAMLLRSLIHNGYRSICILATYLHNLREQVRDGQPH
jgi:protein-tyrosine-phosphatase